MRPLAYIVLSWLIAWPLKATGLSTPLIEVQLNDIPLGQTVAIESGAEKGLYLFNPGKEVSQVDIQVVSPTTAQLRRRAIPIPDPSWIQVMPGRLTLRPGESQVCALRLTVPNDPRYRGKYYQAMIWSRATPTSKRGVGLSAGLFSRILFRTSR